MNVAATGLGSAAAIGALTALGALVLPARAARPAAVGIGTALTGAAGAVAGVAAMIGPGFAIALPGLLPLAGVSIAVDALGGLFVAVTGAVTVAAGVYQPFMQLRPLADDRRRQGLCCVRGLATVI
ncbi:hypothetical protein [Saccharopolyspora pogona]|uniref:hypothetical protein n=1 Tax=Saccharopolyspora pogona TaxID=333966 RepID=UPI001683D72E|nr:hypothetical protein [Saccharopolyspora pogona]